MDGLTIRWNPLIIQLNCLSKRFTLNEKQTIKFEYGGSINEGEQAAITIESNDIG